MPSILITGASSGLGAEMARQFAALGHDLALCARRTDRLEELAAEITRTHPGVRVVVKALDVNDHDSVFRVFEEFRAELGGLDQVVRVVKVVVYVAGAPSFTSHPQVANGASSLIGEVFGASGRHARSAVGCSSLPMDTPVEVELIVEAAARPSIQPVSA